MDTGINTEQIKDILKEELSINYKPDWGANYIDGIDECAERLVNFISSNLLLSLATCQKCHKPKPSDRYLMCPECYGDF